MSEETENRISFIKGEFQPMIKVLHFRGVISGVASLLVFISSALSQSQFEVTIQQFNADEVRGYVQPLGDMFGANMNAGMSHSAVIPRSGFHFRFDVIGMASLVRDEHRNYDAVLPTGFVPLTGSYKTSTVFGGRGTTFKDVSSGLEYKGSDGIIRTDYFPLLVPQITIGSFYGTEATIRYITTPELSGGKLPSSTLWGVGVRHSLSQYFGETPPLDLCLGVYYSNYSIGDFGDFNGNAIDLQLSKALLLFTFYGGIAVENSSMSLRYTYTANGLTTPKLVDVELDGENRFRLTTGLQIDLQAIKLFADVNFGHIQHFSGGIGFGF